MQNQKIYDLKKRSFIFSLNIIKFLNALKKDYIFGTIGKQLLRSATSVGANIIEAHASQSKKDFAHYYNIALKSSNESRYWIELIIKSGFESQCASVLLQEATELSNILAKSLITMRSK